MAGIEREPPGVEITSCHALEIHRLGFDGRADVAEITGAIARRNAHPAAQHDGKIGDVATDADALRTLLLIVLIYL
jgi:hypothetical protein